MSAELHPEPDLTALQAELAACGVEIARLRRLTRVGNYETVTSRHHAGAMVEMRTSYPSTVAVVARPFAAVAEVRTKRGKVTQPAVPAHVDCIMSLPLPLVTTDPAELRANAVTLLDAADVLARMLSGAALSDNVALCTSTAEPVAIHNPDAARSTA